MIEFRCVRNTEQNKNVHPHKKVGYYVKARSAYDAFLQMAEFFPEDTMKPSVEKWGK
jgi:hypothetical protein